MIQCTPYQTLADKHSFENDDFPAPIIRSLYIIDRFGFIRPATTPPTTFKDFVIRTISAMNPSTLRDSISKGWPSL